MTSEAGSAPRTRPSQPEAPRAVAAAPDPETTPRKEAAPGAGDAKTGHATNGHERASVGAREAWPVEDPTGPVEDPTGPIAGPTAQGGKRELTAGPEPATPLRNATAANKGGHSRLIQDDPLAALVVEAQAAVSEGANALRDIRERYRTAYRDRVGQFDRLRTQTGDDPAGSQAAHDEAMIGREVNVERSTLDRIDLAVRSLENAWLFLAREDTSLVSDPSGPPSAADAQMRIVEAQEAERSRLAREIHDGPAQALANAIFQVELVQRLLDRDQQQARDELAELRGILNRELRGVRAYLSQLRPPALADLGLSGAIEEAATQVGTTLDVPVEVELDDGVDALPETVEIVTLRVVQEALQNARKHGQPRSIRVHMARRGGGWELEVRDDGRGFDSDDPPVSGRRHFGLQFMRERAELIGARFEVRSSPNLGTAVRMTIPPGAMGMPIPGEES